MLCSFAKNKKPNTLMVFWKNNSAKHLKKQHVVKGVTGENLIKLLEARLDNTVYPYGYCSYPSCCPSAGKPQTY